MAHIGRIYLIHVQVGPSEMEMLNVEVFIEVEGGGGGGFNLGEITPESANIKPMFLSHKTATYKSDNPGKSPLKHNNIKLL